MKIAIEGCAHGELEIIYESIRALEEKEKIKVDLLICCGDFQACRNEQDLYCMAVPPKYYNMCTFYKYYNGEKQAPVLTVFIGGNHEASNYLQELPYGGWVATNIYYMGYAGVIGIGGVRIAGLSGIYKGQDYLKGRNEKPPYNNDTKRSVYHVRNLEVFRLKQLSGPVDIFLSHDWPTGIWNHGNVRQLLRFKPFFKHDIETGKLGSRPCEDLLDHLQPKYYFAAHLHCKFAALVRHSNKRTTKFLALDKCLPKRRFLQVLEVPHDASSKIEIAYDLEWLTILRLTNHLLSVKPVMNYMPSSSSKRWQFTPTVEEKNNVSEKFADNLLVPNNFSRTAQGYDARDRSVDRKTQPLPKVNPQTTLFVETLSIDDPLALLDAFANSSNAKLDGGASPNNSTCSDEDVSARETFAQSTPVKLTLPEPLFDNAESFSDEACSPARGNSAGATNSTSDGKTATDSLSGPKKFKRRNASIYGGEGTT